MANQRDIQDSKNRMEMKWSPVVGLSFLFHLAVFSTILFLPQSTPTARPLEGMVYEVNLVEMPAGDQSKGKSAGIKKKSTGKAAVKKSTQAKRIKSSEKSEKPLVVAKRTAKKRKPDKKKPKTSSSELIDRAISKIEKKVKSDGEAHIERAITRLERKASDPSGSGSTGEGTVTGIPIRMYQMEVESRIKSNWAYPVALQDSKQLEATVVVMVRRDGTIIKTKVKKRSSNAIFDQSVLKAIERSDPLPPFPEGYRKSYDDIEINFNLQDLEDY